MPILEPVRVQILHFGAQYRFGVVLSSEHPEIQAGLLASAFAPGRPDVMTPVLFASNSQPYRADYSPLRAGEDEVQRMYFIRSKVGWWVLDQEGTFRTQVTSA